MPITVYTATKGGQLAGYAVESMTKNGFGGAINMMVGFTPDGEVINVNVLKQAETPGLGTKMADADNVLLRSVKGQKLEEKKLVNGKLAVAKDGTIILSLCKHNYFCDERKNLNDIASSFRELSQPPTTTSQGSRTPFPYEDIH